MSDQKIKLWNCELSNSYVISDIQTNESDMKEFLFTLGCYPGETVTIISQLASNLIINVKDARYSIDANLASAILVQQHTQTKRRLHPSPEMHAKQVLLKHLA